MSRDGPGQAAQSAILPVYAPAPLVFSGGAGPWLESAEGERYLDFAAGIGVNALGYGHPHLTEALQRALARPWHLSNLYRIPGQERLAQRLAQASFAETVFFANSGGEAVECAIKMARSHFAAQDQSGRCEIITFEGAFHGRTTGAIAAAGLAEGFGPALPGFVQRRFGDLAHAAQACTEKTAAILLEPIQGEGGIRPASAAFLRGLRELADAHGLLLIFDEVQCGIGRTGKLFAYEHSGVAPDILATAKGLGGGFPVGACLATRRAASGMTRKRHGSTFGGNPLAMAAGNAVLDVLLAPGFLAHVRGMGLRLTQKLAMLKSVFPDVIEDWRGEGLMFGLVCRRGRGAALVEAARGRGLLTVGAQGDVVRLLPPLIIEEEHLQEAVARLEGACAEVSGGGA